MKVYSYHHDTKEFTGSKDASPNPLVKDEFLLPANATIKKPLTVASGYVSTYSERQEKWVKQEDHRGEEFYSGLEKIIIVDIGPVPKEYTVDPVQPPASWESVRELQEMLINSTLPRIGRYQLQGELGVDTSETGTTYTALLQYCEDVRQNDEASHDTPQEAYDELNGLKTP